MRELSTTPSITVTIGRHTRIYYAFVTTAPAELDSPATVTLHASTFSDVVGFAADPITHDQLRGLGTGRLVLVDAMELAWQRAKYRGHQHHTTPHDPGWPLEDPLDDGDDRVGKQRLVDYRIHGSRVHRSQ